MSKFLDKLKSHTEKLGWNSVEQLSETCLRLAFDMGEGRSQNVLITYFPREDGKGNDLVEISSAVLKLDGLPGAKLGKEMAEKLLRENATRAFSNWAIEDTQDGPYLVAMSGWMLDDLDPEELEFAVLIVSGAADKMEKTLGVDNF